VLLCLSERHLETRKGVVAKMTDVAEDLAHVSVNAIKSIIIGGFSEIRYRSLFERMENKANVECADQ